MMRRLLPLTLLIACEAPVAPPEAEDGGTTGDEMVAGSDETTAAEETGEAALDVPPPQEIPCQKIDFLFVIDDSGSMADEQRRLIEGFPGFIENIGAAISKYDYHMMVVTTAAPMGEPDDTCETQVGAGHLGLPEARSCGLIAGEGGQRYADEDVEDIVSMFSCVATVGTRGSGFETPIWAMAQAITTQSNPGGCNEGFLRDDAILVVTMITDEEDRNDSPGDPALWKEVMVGAKNGDEKAVVMLGLLGDTDLDDGLCEPFNEQGDGAEAAPRLRRFFESFEFGSWESVCSDDYAPFFNAAVADIGEACLDFTPPG